MKIATFNVNSIRQRLPVVLDWAAANQPDVMCLQETKIEDKDFPVMAIEAAGYQVAFRGMKAYNGVATLTKGEPEKVIHGLHDGPDNEDFRIIQVVTGGVTVVNTYVPQGYSVTSEKYVYKLAWFRRLRKYFEESMRPNDPIVWVGDLNVAPEPIDVYHPEKRVNDPDFHVEARTAFKETASWGFTDCFRKLHPDRVQYTYWDYFRSSFQRNFGWRIDHIMATDPMASRCVACEVDVEPRRSTGASDHTIVWAEFQD